MRLIVFNIGEQKMKAGKIFCVIIIVLFAIPFYAFDAMENENEIAEIKKVIQDSLVDGYLNNYDIEAMKKGIHPDFNIIELRDGEYHKRGFESFIEYVNRVKPSRPNGRRNKVRVEFPAVDVAGTAGCAKVDFYVGETLHGTDFITMIKLKDGWKLTSSVAHEW